jgi:hypothetical protein
MLGGNLFPGLKSSLSDLSSDYDYWRAADEIGSLFAATDTFLNSSPSWVVAISTGLNVLSLIAGIEPFIVFCKMEGLPEVGTLFYSSKVD